MKKLIAIILILILIISASITASAFTLPEFLRVGLYFGDNARTNMKITSPDGLWLGYYQGVNFTPIWQVGDVIIRKDTHFALDANGINGIAEVGGGAARWGPYHVQYHSDVTLEEAPALIANLRAQGVNTYLAVIGMVYHIWGGTHISHAAAQQAAAQSPVPATVAQVSDRRINVMCANTMETVMVFGHMTLGLGVRPVSEDIHNQRFNIHTAADLNYRGGLDFIRLDGGNLTVTNVVHLEHYLYHVVPREMPASWHIEALKAQAVAARNFAVTAGDRHPGQPFNLCNTVHCQVYLGTTPEIESAVRAVRETSGRVLLFDGRPARVFYSSSFGGPSDYSQNVWVSPIPYLIPVSNHYEDTENINNGVWSNTLTVQQATDRLRARGHDIGTVTNIEVLEYTRSGNVLRMRVTGTNGYRDFMREQARIIFGPTTLSQRFAVARGGTGPSVLHVPNLDGGGTGGTGGGNAAPIYIIDRTGVARAINSQNLTVMTAMGLQARGGPQTTPSQPSGNYIATIVAQGSDPNTFYFSGRGWGNPVGMSQFGARGMAEAGYTYDQILMHFLSGTYMSR
ncbi:MAG: SpoIID/LytB domain-containing protein [Oscillospiraceae bacterium]|nr:SpoIID/LytB domain-containing protein [Oscillospiraceae bacterium]